MSLVTRSQVTTHALDVQVECTSTVGSVDRVGEDAGTARTVNAPIARMVIH